MRTMEANLLSKFYQLRQMAALFILMSVVKVSYADEEMALVNVTRILAGDIFTLSGSDCGPTRCMEVSHGTALSMLGISSGCTCQCSQDTPAFRDDQMICVNQIEEYLMASFGGAKRPTIPYVFLPLKGQIIYPSKEIIFTDVEEATCAVTSAQYLSASGWVTLRDVTDNDVPFSVYRDEGSTFLQWRGSLSLHARLEGRLIAVHVLCSSTPRVASSCAAFRIAGNASPAPLYDVRSIPFHAGEVIPSEPARTTTSGLTILESVAIGVCVLMLIFVYAAGITFYIHYKKRQKRKNKDPESNIVITDNTSDIHSRIDIDSLRLKQNPLLNIENMGFNNKGYTNDSGLSDASEPTSDRSYSHNSQKKVSALIHSRRKKQSRSPASRSPSTPERILEMSQRRSVSPDGLEVAPHSDLSIVDCSVENSSGNKIPATPTGEPVIRRKLYFNPDFFETEHLKNPPPAAIDFLIKIREVMDIAKEKMTSRRFYPILSDIPEEESYHTIDLGWDIPCARQGRRFSAISLKRENSRKAIHCGGCPGCDSNIHLIKSAALSRSNSCKDCFSDDYKQNIVKRWLDEVPAPTPQLAVKPIKSVAKVSGTPRAIEPKGKIEAVSNIIEHTGDIVSHILPPVQAATIIHHVTDHDINIASKDKPTIIETNEIPSYLLDHAIPKKTGTRRVRRKLPPPPAPPVEGIEPVSPEVKKKMQAVIHELSNCRRHDIHKEVAPKIVIPITASDSTFDTGDHHVTPIVRRNERALQDQSMYFDSLERESARKRSISLESVSNISSRRPSLSLSVDKKRSLNDTETWRDSKEAGDGCPAEYFESPYSQRIAPVNEVFVNQDIQYFDNTPKMGSLTIEVRGSPVEESQKVSEDFDPDTLDRNLRKNSLSTNVVEPTIRVEKILLKSGGSFKYQSTPIADNDTREYNQNVSPDNFSRKIGSLRQIYEARKSFKEEERSKPYYERRGSLPYGTTDLTSIRSNSKTPDLIRQIDKGEHQASLPFKLRRGSDVSLKSRKSPLSDNRLSEERDKFSLKDDDGHRRSSRRSTRTRSKRTDLKKLTKKVEDSGYLSTDSNESKRRARYLMQLRHKNILSDSIPVALQVRSNKSPTVQVESDTDDFESLCDGHSESGAESIETDSVFFGNIDDPKHMFSDLSFKRDGDNDIQGQIDSGFVGEAVVVSGDSDSEHKSVISIVAGCDGRGSAASVMCDDENQCGTIVD